MFIWQCYRNFVICVMYRSPSLTNNYTELFEKLQQQLLWLQITFFMYGGCQFRYDSYNSYNVRYYEKVLESLSLSQVVDKPTRYSATIKTLTTSSFLMSVIKNVSVSFDHQIADHGQAVNKNCQKLNNIDVLKNFQ